MFRNPPNSIKFAKGLKDVLGVTKKGLKLNMFSDLSDIEISGRIRDHLTTICTEHPSIDTNKLPAFIPANQHSDIDRMTVFKKLNSIKLTKASPPDDLPKRLIKEFAYELSKPLTHVFNISVKYGIFPECWKVATIIPLPKVKIVEELGELRPVSLTPVLGKVLEGMVADTIMGDILPEVDERQYGNLRGRSTTHYLIYITDLILRGIDEMHNMASLILIDFRKAFDFVDHSTAVTKLYLMGCRSELLPFVADFLTGRRHRVRYQGVTSEYAEITCGVPQGTKLGPVVFMAMANDLVRTVMERAKYVDDLSMAQITRILREITYQMQPKLDTLTQDCIDSLMAINPIKSHVMHVVPPKRPIVLPDLHLQGTPLPVVTECKLLGVYLNNEMNWQTHINYILTRARRCFFILYRARQFAFSVITLLTLYHWYVRTALEYAAPVWHPGLTQDQTKKIERIQKRCFRIILRYRYTTYEDALRLLGETSLHQRRETLTLRLARSILRSPTHRGLLPPTLGDIHGRNTRHRRRLQPVRCRTARYQKSFVPYAVKLLNRL